MEQVWEWLPARSSANNFLLMLQFVQWNSSSPSLFSCCCLHTGDFETLLLCQSGWKWMDRSKSWSSGARGWGWDFDADACFWLLLKEGVRALGSGWLLRDGEKDRLSEVSEHVSGFSAKTVDLMDIQGVWNTKQIIFTHWTVSSFRWHKMQLRASPGQITEIIPLLCASLQMPGPPGGWRQLPGGGCRGVYIEPSLPSCLRAGEPRTCARPAELVPVQQPRGYRSSRAGSPLSDRGRAAVNSSLFVPSVCAPLFHSYCVRNNRHSSSSEPQIFSFREESAAGILACSVVLELCPGSLWKRRASLWPL